jgi:hypothetical protein
MTWDALLRRKPARPFAGELVWAAVGLTAADSRRIDLGGSVAVAVAVAMAVAVALAVAVAVGAAVAVAVEAAVGDGGAIVVVGVAAVVASGIGEEMMEEFCPAGAGPGVGEG